MLQQVQQKLEAGRRIESPVHQAGEQLLGRPGNGPVVGSGFPKAAAPATERIVNSEFTGRHEEKGSASPPIGSNVSGEKKMAGEPLGRPPSNAARRRWTQLGSGAGVSGPDGGSSGCLM